MIPLTGYLRHRSEGEQGNGSSGFQVMVASLMDASGLVRAGEHVEIDADTRR